MSHSMITITTHNKSTTIKPENFDDKERKWAGLRSSTELSGT